MPDILRPLQHTSVLKIVSRGFGLYSSSGLAVHKQEGVPYCQARRWPAPQGLSLRKKTSISTLSKEPIGIEIVPWHWVSGDSPKAQGRRRSEESTHFCSSTFKSLRVHKYVSKCTICCMDLMSGPYLSPHFLMIRTLIIWIRGYKSSHSVCPCGGEFLILASALHSLHWQMAQWVIPSY